MENDAAPPPTLPAAEPIVAVAPAPPAPLDMDAVKERAIRQLQSLPHDIYFASGELDDEMDRLRDLEERHARFEQHAMDIALNDASNTNETKRKLAAKTLMATDPEAMDTAARIKGSKQVVAVLARKVQLARDEFTAAKSIARIIGAGA